MESGGIGETIGNAPAVIVSIGEGQYQLRRINGGSPGTRHDAPPRHPPRHIGVKAYPSTPFTHGRVTRQYETLRYQ
nr:hypothetical protein MFLOJ_15640 [Mycobacterium florentinum]